MLYANKSGEKIQPQPGARAECPACGGEVIAKCGSIYTWHWSHVAADCDPWSEPETEWHKGWKDRFPPECREVVIGPHRADVLTKSGIVIEFQHSPISVDEILEREDFYGKKMVWLLDGSVFKENMELRVFGTLGFTWSHPRRCWWASQQPLFIDFSGRLFKVRFFNTKKDRVKLCRANGRLFVKACNEESKISADTHKDLRGCGDFEDVDRFIHDTKSYTRKQRIRHMDFATRQHAA